MEKPKKKASLIMADKPSSDDMTTEADESSGDSMAAAGEVFDALKSGDREGFITALKAAVLTCK